MGRVLSTAVRTGEPEQKLQLMLKLMAAFAGRYLDAAHVPPGFLRSVLEETQADEAVTAVLKSLADR